MFIPFENISLHALAHAALTFYKRLFFFFFFFFKFYFFQKMFSDIRYTIRLDPINIPYFVMPDLGPS